MKANIASVEDTIWNERKLSKQRLRLVPVIELLLFLCFFFTLSFKGNQLKGYSIQFWLLFLNDLQLLKFAKFVFVYHHSIYWNGNPISTNEQTKELNQLFLGIHANWCIFILCFNCCGFCMWVKIVWIGEVSFLQHFSYTYSARSPGTWNYHLTMFQT